MSSTLSRDQHIRSERGRKSKDIDDRQRTTVTKSYSGRKREKYDREDDLSSSKSDYNSDVNSEYQTSSISSSSDIPPPPRKSRRGNRDERDHPSDFSSSQSSSDEESHSLTDFFSKGSGQKSDTSKNKKSERRPTVVYITKNKGDRRSGFGYRTQRGTEHVDKTRRIKNSHIEDKRREKGKKRYSSDSSSASQLSYYSSDNSSSTSSSEGGGVFGSIRAYLLPSSDDGNKRRSRVEPTLDSSPQKRSSLQSSNDIHKKKNVDSKDRSGRVSKKSSHKEETYHTGSRDVGHRKQNGASNHRDYDPFSPSQYESFGGHPGEVVSFYKDNHTTSPIGHGRRKDVPDINGNVTREIQYPPGLGINHSDVSGYHGTPVVPSYGNGKYADYEAEDTGLAPVGDLQRVEIKPVSDLDTQGGTTINR